MKMCRKHKKAMFIFVLFLPVFLAGFIFEFFWRNFNVGRSYTVDVMNWFLETGK